MPFSGKSCQIVNFDQKQANQGCNTGMNSKINGLMHLGGYFFNCRFCQAPHCNKGQFILFALSCTSKYRVLFFKYKTHKLTAPLSCKLKNFNSLQDWFDVHSKCWSFCLPVLMESLPVQLPGQLCRELWLVLVVYGVCS